jgi:hypothetical protein
MNGINGAFSAFGRIPPGPITSNAWVFVAPFALTMLMLEEGRKAIVRWREGADEREAVGRQAGATPATKT